MYIRLRDNCYNLEHVASFGVSSNAIYVLLKDRTTSNLIHYKTPAEAQAVFEKIWETLEQHNLSRTK